MDPTESTALLTLLRTQPVASLATLHLGAPAVSMVPFALLPDGPGFVIHVSQLALPRASIQGTARGHVARG